MKKFVIYTILFISSFFLLNSCKQANPFYGVAEEDTEGPSITVTYPSTSTTITGVFNFKGTAEDKGGNEVYKIEVSTDSGSTWKEASGTVNWTITIDPFSEWGVVTSSTRTIFVRATDTSSNKNTNTISVTYTLNNTNPNLVGTISDTKDTVDYDGNATTDGYHNITEGLTVTYQWEDDSSFTGGYKVTLYDITGTVANNIYNIPRASISASCDAGTVVSSGITGVSGNSFCLSGSYINFSFTGTNGHKYYASVRGYDSSLAEGSATSSVTTTLDNAVPVINTGTINFLANSQGDAYVHDTGTITFTWTNSAASDSETGIRYFKIYLTGSATATYSTDSSASSYTASLSSGTYTATIKCVDMAGNVSTTYSAITSFVVNTSTPSDVGTISDNSGDQYYNATEIATSLQFSWSNISAASGYDIQVVRNDGKIDTYSPSSITSTSTSLSAGSNTGISGVSVVNNSGTIQFAFTPTTGYSYQVQVKAYNSAGTRSSSWSSSSLVTIDTTAPSNSSASVTDSGTYSTSTSLTFSWSGFSDSGSGISGYQVSYSINGGSYSTATTISATTYTVSISDGSNNVVLRVRAVDKAGNTSSYSYSDGITVDATAPSFTTTPANGVTSYSNSTPSWTISLTETGSGLDYYEYYIYTDGVPDITNKLTATSSPISISSPTNGSKYQLYIRAVDKAGNISAWVTTGTIVYDTSAPSGLSISSFSDTGSLTASFVWTSATETGSYVSSYVLYVYDSGDSSKNATITVTMDSSGSSILSVSITSNTGILSSASTGSASSPYGVNLTFNAGFASNYVVSLKAIDAAGNDSGYAVSTASTLID